MGIALRPVGTKDRHRFRMWLTLDQRSPTIVIGLERAARSQAINQLGRGDGHWNRFDTSFPD
jgi:hypothetical protein